jgi:hypothetical protein
MQSDNKVLVGVFLHLYCQQTRVQKYLISPLNIYNVFKNTKTYFKILHFFQKLPNTKKKNIKYF